MQPLKDVIDRAVSAGLVMPQAAPALTAFLMRNGVSASEPTDAAAGGGSDREYPRFVRGFHDILITIGLLVGLVGLGGLATPLATPVAILVLSELFVKRQRLALPAVALAIGALLNTVIIVGTYIPKDQYAPDALYAILGMFFSVPAVMGLYFWRYGTPLAAALTAGSAIVAAIFSMILALRVGGVLTQEAVDNPTVIFGLGLGGGLALFVAALSCDLKDPLRITARSDMGFWMHLMAAPSILYSTLMLLDFDIPAAVAVLVTMALVGLIIDRRTFVTAGLLSLGYIIYTGIGEGRVSGDQLFFIAMTGVGSVVLTIGSLWSPLRRAILGILPPSIADRLPPA